LQGGIELLEQAVKRAEKALKQPAAPAPATENDKAMIEGKPQNVGGIDLNPALLDLQIKRDGNGIPLPLPQQPLQQMHIEGFVPVIINVTPIANLPVILGLGAQHGGTEYGSTGDEAVEPDKV